MVLLYCLWYLVTKILKLQIKQFHALMLTAIVVTSLNMITNQSLKLNLAMNYDNLSSKSFNIQYNIYYYLTQVYFALDVMIHTVFVCKYWTLSKQLESIVDGRIASDGSKINCQVTLILTLQVALCLASVVIPLVWPN